MNAWPDSVIIEPYYSGFVARFNKNSFYYKDIEELTKAVQSYIHPELAKIDIPAGCC